MARDQEGLRFRQSTHGGHHQGASLDIIQLYE